MFPIEQAEPFILEQIQTLCKGSCYQLVDPKTARVYDYRGGTLVDGGSSCFTVWDVTASLVETNELCNKSDLIGRLLERFNLMAVQDTYTGLYNKCFAEQEMSRLVQAWCPEMPFTIAMLDLDHFKTINDTYGHPQGGIVIETVAGLLQECARLLGGTACRVGGDEFLLLVSGRSLSVVTEAIVGIRERLEACCFGQASPFHVSFNVGIARYQSELGHWKALLQQTDQLMYQEKVCRTRHKATEWITKMKELP